VTSPSFTIISEYEGPIPFYHIDLYRIEREEELELLGIEEILYGEGVSVIEWAEKATGFLPEDTVCITIAIGENSEREIAIEGLEL
jgi:tRNA threonylcarbamoyladenosine biosynthesis protein TsaE